MEQEFWFLPVASLTFSATEAEEWESSALPRSGLSQRDRKGSETGKFSLKTPTQELFKQIPNLAAQSLPLFSPSTSPNPVLLTSTLAFPPFPHLPSLGEALAQRPGHLTHEETSIFGPIFMAYPHPQPQNRTQKLLTLQNILVI